MKKPLRQPFRSNDALLMVGQALCQVVDGTRTTVTMNPRQLRWDWGLCEVVDGSRYLVFTWCGFCKTTTKQDLAVQWVAAIHDARVARGRNQRHEIVEA